MIFFFHFSLLWALVWQVCYQIIDDYDDDDHFVCWGRVTRQESFWLMIHTIYSKWLAANNNNNNPNMILSLCLVIINSIVNNLIFHVCVSHISLQSIPSVRRTPKSLVTLSVAWIGSFTFESIVLSLMVSFPFRCLCAISW